MKKTFLYGLMACLSLAFYACGSDSDDKGAIPGNSRSTTPPSYQKEPKADCANKFISNAGNVEFFGNGKYSMPAGMKDKSLSARQMRMSPAAPDTYATGTYDYADGVYTLDNGTTITVNGNSLLFDEVIIEPKAVAEPIRAMTHIQNTAPGPPMAMAVATPARLPVPTRVATLTAKA
jgi:hypothetical protein